MKVHEAQPSERGICARWRVFPAIVGDYASTTVECGSGARGGGVQRRV